ncbi:MAG: lysozyme [Betaproteobacteria bacterium]
MSNPQNENLKISPAGLALIKKWEGWYPKAYKDPVGVWTIGWGTTGAEARPGRTITKAQGEAFLKKDLEDEEANVKRLVNVPLTQYQFDALVSFAYNAGSGNLSQSTLLKLLNRKNYTAAAAQFVRWNKARNRETNEYVVLNGLTNRRKDEAALFLRPAEAQFEEHEVNMEGQKPLADPQNHESTVSADAPSSHPSPFMDLLKNSETFKAIATTITGLIVAFSNLLEPVKENPTAYTGLGLAVIGALAVVYIKYRDTNEGR